MSRLAFGEKKSDTSLATSAEPHSGHCTPDTSVVGNRSSNFRPHPLQRNS